MPANRATAARVFNRPINSAARTRRLAVRAHLAGAGAVSPAASCPSWLAKARR